VLLPVETVKRQRTRVELFAVDMEEPTVGLDLSVSRAVRQIARGLSCLPGSGREKVTTGAFQIIDPRREKPNVGTAAWMRIDPLRSD